MQEADNWRQAIGSWQNKAGSRKLVAERAALMVYYYLHGYFSQFEFKLLVHGLCACVWWNDWTEDVIFEIISYSTKVVSFETLELGTDIWLMGTVQTKNDQTLKQSFLFLLKYQHVADVVVEFYGYATCVKGV